jgi:anti-sigma factor RsiW
MIECTGIAELLGAFRDGELEPDKVAIVARHLAACTQCEMLLSEICELGETLRASAWEPCLDGFAEQVLSRVARLPEPFSRRLRRGLGALGWSWPAAITSASLATALASWLVLMTFGKPNTPSITAAGSNAVTEVRAGESAAQGGLAQALGLSYPGPKDQVVISRLETDRHHVALWSEPEGTTTVIWLPEEPEISE